MREKQRKGKSNVTGEEENPIHEASITSDNDKFDGAGKEVKKLLRYRTKTLDNLR
jgi:hypothetical protein